MRRKGVVYDTGCVMGVNWRPDYSPDLVRRELEVIKTGLHCTAVKLRGRDTSRLARAAEQALGQGLEVWLSPEHWNKSPAATLQYIARAAAVAEELRVRWPGQVVFSVGPELNLFDIIGIDHYWFEPVKDHYLRALEPLLATGKPVVITEFGFRTRTGADQTGPAGPENIDPVTMSLHLLPLTGRFVRPRVKTIHDRNEELQARCLTRQLELLDTAGVDGAFVYTFTAPLFPHGRDPAHDLDTDSFSLVKPCSGGQGGAFPDLPWEPKKSFEAIAGYYATR
jgi:hypothetical protein